MNKKELCDIAVTAREKAYSPYSGVRVGAALLCADGTVYEGCNIENASYTPTVCAERVAFFRAISEGKRDFTAIAVAGDKGDGIDGAFPPCGVCRQVMAEFCPPEFKILLVTGDGFSEHTLKELLPLAFSLEK